ncbi:MAG: hypothetical protein RI942_865 [Pseudomonadota bacterium]
MILPTELNQLAMTTPGFLSQAEGEALAKYLDSVAGRESVVEIGSYCGKSTLYLGHAAKLTKRIVYAIDHHQGSVEHQPGEFFYDTKLTDAEGKTDTLLHFRHTIRKAKLDHCVFPLVGPANVIGLHWQQPLGLLFIDGGHSIEDAVSDYRLWSRHVVLGGIMAVHDHYPSASAGGQAPKAIIDAALASGLWRREAQVDSLALLRRLI